ncbi:MAG TPA: MlaD family protein [Baekduia sp.]|nr:MlaD family protein [Baekduia sp.]
MSTRARRTGGVAATAANPIVVGSIILMAAIVGIVLSYTANRGLPFVPTYEVRAEVLDAAELIEGSSEVRVGGSRVGIVKEVEAVAPGNGRRAYAVLRLALDADQEGIPTDSTVQVAPRSILGAKFVDLRLGTAARELPNGGVLPIRQAIAGVQLDEAFGVFEPRTRRAVQRAVTNLGDALAGRGSALNDTVADAGRLIAPLQRTLRVLVRPDTELDALLSAAAGASAALAPVAGELAAVVDDGATTMRAVAAAGPELEAAVAAAPATFAAGTRAARASAPVLADAAAIARELRPATGRLRPALRALDRAVRVTTPVLGRVPGFSGALDDTLQALGALARRDSAIPAVIKLTQTVTSLDRTLDVLLPAQVTCNAGALFVRNLGGVIDTGDPQGNWLTFVPVLEPSQSFQQARPAANLHANPRPTNDASECETGNEPYLPGQRIGSPGASQGTTTELTRAPAQATARARAAGLLEAGR